MSHFCQKKVFDKEGHKNPLETFLKNNLIYMGNIFKDFVATTGNK